MDINRIKRILDEAPEWATHFDQAEKQYYPEDEGFIDGLDLRLSDLRTELAKREPMDLRDVDIPHGTIVLEK